LGFYACPEQQVELISTWLSNPHRSRFVDPCVGEGEALCQLRDNLGGPDKVETWAIEISPERFAIASPRFNRCLPTSFYLAKWWDRSVSMAWVNPPYDYSEYRDTTGNKIRHERLFIQKVTPKLVPGGVMIGVIPQAQLADEALATILAGWYDRLRVFKFVGDDYNVFKQVFVIGVRKEKYRNPRDTAIEGIQYCGKISEARLMDICERPAEVEPYVIPALTDEYEDVFAYTPMTHAARMYAISKCSPVRGNLEHRKMHYIRPLGAAINPAIQEKTGHIAMELSSGDVGVVPIEIEGAPALIKGTLVKIAVQKVEKNDDPSAETQKVTEVEKLVTRISLTRHTGEIQLISSAAEVAEMMMEHGHAIAQSLLTRNVPTYDMKPRKHEWELACKLGLGLKPLPGRKERGLFEMQKHLSIAASRVSRRYNHIIMNCDMGTGKTSMATATLELMNKWPVILMCPGHMQEKWKRELAEVSVQTDKIVSRIIDVAVREGHSWYESSLVPLVEGDAAKKMEKLGKIVEYTRLQLTPTESSNGRRARLVLEISPDRLTILLARLKGQRLRPEVVSGADLMSKGKHVTVEINDRDLYTLVDFVDDYQAGKLGRKAVLICSFEVAKMDAGFEDALVKQNIFVKEEVNGELHQGLVKRKCCSTCGQPYKEHPKHPGHCGNKLYDREELEPEEIEVEVKVWGDPLRNACGDLVDAEGNLLGLHDDPVYPEPTVETVKKYKRKWKIIERLCGAPSRQMTRWRKQSLARLVQKKYAHFFKVYVADEIHKCFPGTTPISTPNGDVQIKDIRTGDEVLSYKDGQVVTRKVVQVFRSPSDGDLVRVTHTGGSFVCTPNHNIYVDGQYVMAGDLKPGQPLTDLYQGSAVILVEKVHTDDRTVFNFEVEDTHCYFAANVLVSNCQAGDTDIGTADGRLLSACDHSIALTGTLFGGKASSLFYLLYRRVHDVRQDYKFEDGHSKWVDDFGIWEHKWTEELQGHQTGVSTGLRRFNKRSKEKPGISPAVIRYILPQVIFGKITDLGYHLPPLSEHIEQIRMARDQQDQYDAACETLLHDAMVALKEDHDAGPLAAWLQVARYRPNSGFRDEQAFVREEAVYDLPDVSNGKPLPKEKTLAELVAENKKHGRKTLVFVEQTASRDIRQRLQAQIENLAPEVRVGVLSSNITPRKRELWIAQNIPNIDVLIVNPKLVETGLDLVMFQDIVFFEITYSLYVLWQAMRRVWRLGQAHRVCVWFYVYKGTMEAGALALMGTKMKYAMMLYGDNAAGTLIDETEETDEDIAREMMRRAVEGATYEDLGQLNGHLFTDENQHEVIDMTESPMGSPTAQSAPLPTISQPEAVQRTMADMLFMLAATTKSAKGKKAKVSEYQAVLF
jgi:hypothetical protein